MQSLQKHFTISLFVALRSAFIWRLKKGPPAPCCLWECRPRGPQAAQPARTRPLFILMRFQKALAAAGDHHVTPVPRPGLRLILEDGRRLLHHSGNPREHQVPKVPHAHPMVIE